MLSIDFTGKVALVTGGARGIGRAISLKFARAGADVAIFDLLEEEAEKTVGEIFLRGKEACFFKVDVTEEKEVQNAVEKLIKKYGRIDFLVNNAGITSKYSFSEIPLDVWRKTIEVNLTGAFLCCRKVVPHMVKRKEGRIVFVSSASSLTGSGGGAHYASSKGAVNSLVRALSRELAPYNILVNAVAPRNIQAGTLQDIYSEKELAGLLKKIPLGRMGTGEEVADVVVFLCSALSTYITGQIIIVDGGRTFGAN